MSGPASRADVLRFISRFTGGGRREQVIDAFTNGCCYWFAAILTTRFPEGVLVYDEVANHFAARIGGAVFDITGDISGRYSMRPWSEVAAEDPSLYAILRRDCIMF